MAQKTGRMVKANKLIKKLENQFADNAFILGDVSKARKAAKRKKRVIAYVDNWFKKRKARPL